MNNYETVFIITPVLSDEQVAETVGKFKEFIKENGGTVDQDENWGLRKLTYPIQKKSTGFYHLLEFTAPGEIVLPLEIAFKRDERVIRWLTTRMDKHHVAYAPKRRERLAKHSS
ncbi:MAG: small subunit ribosomal protein S6 [Flavobacteriales bacterium]|jgi:small subunit ribosomal protein S6